VPTQRQRAAPSNGNGNRVWRAVLVIVLAGVILGAVGGAWSLNERVTRTETRVDRMGEDIAEIKGDVKRLVRWSKPPDRP